MEHHTPESFNLRPATLEDAESIAGLLNACAIELTGKPRANTRQVAGILRTPGLDPATNSRLAVGPDGWLLGIVLVQDTAPHTQFFVLAEVHARARGRGVGTALCRWAEERARRTMPQARPTIPQARPTMPQVPAGERVVLLQERYSNDEPARELLEGQGYRVVRHQFRMIAELDAPPPPVVPAGLTIRPFAREREGRALVRALREAFRDNWGYVDRPFEEEYRRWMHLLDRDPEEDLSPFWLVGVEGDEIAGLCLGTPRQAGDPESGWIHVLAVRPAWRRRGLALALLQHSFGLMYKEGRRRVGLEVDTQNPAGATQLYQKAGMQVERQSDFYEKELRPASTHSGGGSDDGQHRGL